MEPIKEIEKLARDIHFELILYKKLLRKLQKVSENKTKVQK